MAGAKGWAIVVVAVDGSLVVSVGWHFVRLVHRVLQGKQERFLTVGICLLP